MEPELKETRREAEGRTFADEVVAGEMICSTPVNEDGNKDIRPPANFSKAVAVLTENFKIIFRKLYS